MSSAQLSPVGPPLPPGAGRDSGGARRARPPALPPPEPRRWSGHSPPPTTAARLPRGRGEGTRGPELERRPDRSSRAGLGCPGTRPWRRGDSGRSSPARGWGGGGGGKAAVRDERGTLAVRLSKQAGPEAGPEPLPAPCAPPGPPLRAHTHSRVCLARERCPWLHNSPDGIRPSVFLNRAAKKVRVVCGQRLATPRLIGGWVGLEQTGASSGPL